MKRRRPSLPRIISERERRGVGTSTIERVLRSGEDIEIGQDGRQRVAQAPLDRLRSRKLIEPREYEAGDRYREDAWQAGMMPSWGSLMEPRDRSSLPGHLPRSLATVHAAAAYQRWTNAQSALGPRLAPVVDEVCWASEAGTSLSSIGARLFGRRDDAYAAAALIETAKLALGTLADHYEGK